MTISPPSRTDFEQLLAEHAQTIRLANDLEYHLYRIGAEPAPEHVTACQQAGGALIRHLRTLLFRHDQQVLPLLDSLIPFDSSGHPPISASTAPNA
jgi:hypothetical protein